MNNKASQKWPAKAVLWSLFVVIVMATLFLATPKPASAGSSFSISIGSGGYRGGYHSWHGHSRPWHGGYYDSWHHYHTGYNYGGPVVYQPVYVPAYSYGSYYGYTPGGPVSRWNFYHHNYHGGSYDSYVRWYWHHH